MEVTAQVDAEVKQHGERSADNAHPEKEDSQDLKLLVVTRGGNVEPGNLYPFAIFPHEIWKGIVNNLKDSPATCWNLITAYSQLREEVIKKTEVLFQKVLPLVFPELEKKDTLACRKVCKWWRNAVDQFLEEHHSQQAFCDSRNETVYRSSTILEKKYMQTMVWCHLNSLLDMTEFAKASVAEDKKAPVVVGRSIAFKHDTTIPEGIHNKVDMGVYYNSLAPFLEMFGSSIHFASVPLTSTLGTNEDVADYEGLARCLSFLSNLKSLTLSIPIQNWVNTTFLYERIAFNQLLLIKRMNSHALPALPQLRCLDVSGSSIFTDSITKSVLTHVLRFYSGQLEKLTINLWNCNVDEGTLLSNVTDLKLVRWSRFYSPWSRLSSLLQALGTDKLRKIEIGYVYWGLSGMWEMLGKFQKLEVITLNWSDRNAFPPEEEMIPMFSFVQVLKIRVENRFERSIRPIPGLKILKSFPGLEYLEISFAASSPTEAYRRDKIGKKLLECVVILGNGFEAVSVWALLPKLKCFVLGEKRFARQNAQGK